jgi:RHS repeat-associated protein
LNYRTNNALVETFSANAANELSTISRTSGTLTVAGFAELSSPLPSVTVSNSGFSPASGAATVYNDGSWARAGGTVSSGQNVYLATATDSNGRTSQDTVTVTLTTPVTCTYDANGNLLNDGQRYFSYDDENQLTSVTVSNAWRSEFTYDGLLRRRKRVEYAAAGTTWVKTNEVRYVYDGRLALQERDGSNLPLINYTRGKDLAGDFESAGGIGGLLARTDAGLLAAGSPSGHSFYNADANGNVTCLINLSNAVVAQYSYDPFGNVISKNGSLADANLYRFSSKEYHPNSGLSYYLYRYDDFNLQRWLNRDPICELGGLNLYRYCANACLSKIDPLGLDTYVCNRQLAQLSPAGGPGAVPANEFLSLSHTFVFTTNPDGSVRHTFSWGNSNNLRGWNLDQPEDTSAANDALQIDYARKVGDQSLDPFVQQSFNLLNKAKNEHGNCWVFNNCKTEKNNLLDLARTLQSSLYSNSDSGSNVNAPPSQFSCH